MHSKNYNAKKINILAASGEVFVMPVYDS